MWRIKELGQQRELLRNNVCINTSHRDDWAQKVSKIIKTKNFEYRFWILDLWRKITDNEWSIHTRPSNSSSAWKVKRAFWRGDSGSALRNQFMFWDIKTAPKLGPSNGTIFRPACGQSLYPATSKNGDKATLALPVPSPPKTMFSKESFALSPKKRLPDMKQNTPHAHRCSCKCLAIMKQGGQLQQCKRHPQLESGFPI